MEKHLFRRFQTLSEERGRIANTSRSRGSFTLFSLLKPGTSYVPCPIGIGRARREPTKTVLVHRYRHNALVTTSLLDQQKTVVDPGKDVKPRTKTASPPTWTPSARTRACGARSTNSRPPHAARVAAHSRWK